MHDGRVFVAAGLACLTIPVIAVAVLDNLEEGRAETVTWQRLCGAPAVRAAPPHTNVVVVELIRVALELVADAEPLPDEGVDVVVVHVVVAALLGGGAHRGGRRGGSGSAGAPSAPRSAVCHAAPYKVALHAVATVHEEVL